MKFNFNFENGKIGKDKKKQDKLWSSYMKHHFM